MWLCKVNNRGQATSFCFFLHLLLANTDWQADSDSLEILLVHGGLWLHLLLNDNATYSACAWQYREDNTGSFLDGCFGLGRSLDWSKILFEQHWRRWEQHIGSVGIRFWGWLAISNEVSIETPYPTIKPEQGSGTAVFCQCNCGYCQVLSKLYL